MTNSWVNWAGDQRCTPAAVASPRDVAEVAAAVTDAAARGLSVRVAGAGHSFSDTVLTDGLLMDLSRMNRLIEIDTASGLVRLEGGITLRGAGSALHQAGLAFPNLGDIDAQSVAGATATATHGTGARLPNLSAAIESAQLVLADGSVVECSPDSDPDAWRAARVSLGALGVVTALTLRMVPSFVLEGVERPIPIEEVLTDLDAHLDDNDHFEFHLFAHSDMAMTKRNNVVELPERPRGALVDWISDIVLSNYTFDALCRLGRWRPGLIPWIHRGASHAGSYRRQVERSYRVFASPRLIRFTEMEYAVPRDRCADAIREIRDVTRTFDTPMPIEVRWVAPDDALLSPAGGRPTCYIAVHQYRGMAWEPYFRACEAIFDRYDGRPHWGKRHFQTADTLRHRYPEWDRFAAVRRRLDPGATFANPYLDRVLGPVG